MSLNEIVSQIELKFASGNAVPVERATITSGEWAVIRRALKAKELGTTPNTASPKLPADTVEGFHKLLAKHRSSMWSSEQQIMDQVASFIGR
jgi:hypothetical protein